jgi:glycosyltransferase involved in cell wall biosynthesis
MRTEPRIMTTVDTGQFAIIGLDNPTLGCVERRADAVRVLHLINGEHYSGAERVQDLLAMRLPDTGYEVGFVCVRPGRFDAQRRAQDTPLACYPMRGKLDLRPAWQIARLVRSGPYRLLHAHTPRTALLGRLAAGLTGVPMVYHVHSPASRDSTRGWHNWVNSVSERWSVRRALRLICVSASLARHMQAAGFPADRIRVVPNGVPRLSVRPRRQPPAGTWTLGSVALFRPRKGTEVLIEALARLRAQDVPARLRLVGPFESPRYENQIRSLARECGVESAIDWVGYTKDVNSELAKMDLFVLPSLFGEGLPMVVLEAMAAGVPVVGTNVEGVPEAIRHGQDGVITRAGDADDLARGIRRVVQGELDWSAMSENARERHDKEFSDAAMAAGVARVYNEIVSSPSANS